MEEEGYITPIHIKDYIFCPSIFYYKHVLGIGEPLTESMKEGVREFIKDSMRYQERETLLNQRRIRVDKMLFGVTVSSRKHKVVGVVDTVYWSKGKLNVLEIKTTESNKLFPDHLYQVAVYALAVEEEFNQPVYKIIIFYKKSNNWFEKRFTNQMRNYSVKLVLRIHEIMEKGEVPEPRFSAKCRSCFYKRFCYGI
ncbi:MAG: CRISPR-associated protein Cas4 [Nitrososphaerota archaeon]|nr:CRISPR-associated protein Cas4 [Candidatus Geocrenenecus dongiae]